MDSVPPPKPKRRARYKGTHPRNFSEKYKELNPEKYAGDIEKIKQRGATPAGTHRPICVDEILEILKLKTGNTVLDATLGYGGHAREILKKLYEGGTLIGLDQDPIEFSKTEARLRALDLGSAKLILGNINFRGALSFLKQNEIVGVDAVIADLGLSSMQIDDVGRGFTFKHEAVFDLRMNPKKGEPAYQFLRSRSKKNLAQLIYDNSDEPRAAQIAEALAKARPKTTTEVTACVREVMSQFSPRIQKEEGDTPVRRVFQALRIAVNDEYKALEEFLNDLPLILKKGGRVAVLSFHSGEDRRVKKAFQAYLRSGVFKEISSDVIRPSKEEQFSNPRSRPAKLRWGIKK